MTEQIAFEEAVVKTYPQRPSALYKASVESNNKLGRIRVGNTLQVVLSSPKDRYYHWRFVNHEGLEAVKLRSITYKINANQEQDGSIFTLKAVAPGTETLVFEEQEFGKSKGGVYTLVVEVVE